VFGIGTQELIIILLIALIVFGPKKLPEVGRTIGRSLAEFRRASSDIRDELKRGFEDEDTDEPEPSGSEASTTGRASTSAGGPSDPGAGQSS
jgi:sec-independent protein translocase protein TatA